MPLLSSDLQPLLSESEIVEEEDTDSMDDYTNNQDGTPPEKKNGHGDSGELETVYAPATTRMYMAAAFASIGAISMGTVLGWSSPALPSLAAHADRRAYVAENSDEASWVGSLINLGALAGGLSGGIPANMFGRKTTTILACVPFAIGWGIIIGAQKVWMLYLGRLLTGYAAGVISMSVPTYVSECSPPAIRGMLGSFFQLSCTLGILLMYFVGIWLNWYWISVVALVPPAINAVLMFFMPESPYWLITKNRRGDAVKALNFFRGAGGEVEKECDVIQQAISADSENKNVGVGEIFKGYALRPLLVSLMLMLFQQWSGVNAVLFYTTSIFKSAGSSLDPHIATVIVGVVQSIATVGSVFLMDKAGRRLLLLISSAIMAASLAVLGVYYVVHNKSNINWLPLVCTLIFIIAFSIGYGPIPWLMTSEIIPSKVRGYAVSIATALNWGMSFVVTYSYKYVRDDDTGIHDYGAYWLYAGICVANFVYVFFCVPETKGKSLEQIEEYFTSGQIIYLLPKRKRNAV